jgi:carnitine 3-dehydrogenase
MPEARKITKVTCIGGGLIGAGWAAHFMRAGLDVVVHDEAAEREAFVRETLTKAMPVLTELGLAPGASVSRVRFTTDLAEALDGTDFVQESTPEKLDSKNALLPKIDSLTAPDVIIASSSSGFLAADLRRNTAHPERILVGHPFNPPYLVPLVEIAGADAARHAADAATAFYRSTGCEVVELKREITGYIGNRIQSAVMREVLYLMSEGVADLEAIDRAIAAGPAIRWAVMGASSALFLGARDVTLYGRFVQAIAREINGGFVAPPSFAPNDELMQAYAQEVVSTIGANGQSGLMDLRNAGIVGVRGVLERVKDELGES